MAVAQSTPTGATRRAVVTAAIAIVALVATGLPGQAQDPSPTPQVDEQQVDEQQVDEQQAAEETATPARVESADLAITPDAATTDQGRPVGVSGEVLGDAAAAGTRLSVVLEAPDGTVLAGPIEVVTGPDGSWELAFPAAATETLELDETRDFGVTLAARATVVDGALAGQVIAAPVEVAAPPRTLLVEANFTSSVGWVKPGETYPFRLTVRNLTEEDGTDAVVRVPAVPGTTWVSANPIGDGAGDVAIGGDGTLTWDIGTVPAGTVGDPEVVTMVVEARADQLSDHPQLVWKNLSATAELTASGVEASSSTRGPRVIPPNAVYDSARYGDRPFPVVPVDYFDGKHLDRNSGEDLSTVINDPDYDGSTFNLFQEMSYGQLYPEASIPSSDIATADWSDFDTARLHVPLPPGDRPDCTSISGDTPDYNADLIDTPDYPERIVDGFYQLPGDTEYYGSDDESVSAFPNGRIDSGCGPIAKSVYDAAALADPEIDYNDFDTDKDGVVDFFMMVYRGCGGNGPSQRDCQERTDAGGLAATDYTTGQAYDNIWPHKSTLEAYFIDDETGQAGYVTDDRLTTLEGELLFYTDATYTATTTQSTAYPAYVRVGTYNVNPEDAIDAASVISHEYGHSLGLPDYYSASPYGTEYYGTWNLMATDYSQNMDLNARQELGWVIPKEIPEDATDYEVDLTDSKRDIHEVEWRTPDGTPYTLSGPDVHNGDAWTAPLPKSVLLDADLVDNGASPTHVYWSGSGNNFGCAPSPTGHSLDVPLQILEDAEPGDEVILSMKSYWDIEWDYDYGFLLATTDKGLSYESLPSREGYTLPASDNPEGVGCQDRYGNGLTGTSGAWEDGDGLADRGDYVEGSEFLDLSYDLSAYAGEPTDLRMSYFTDSGFVRPGWYVDDVTITINGDPVYVNDFEGGATDGIVNGGCDEGAVITGPCSLGWNLLEAGETAQADHAYFVEARDRAGFDLDANGQSDRGPITWRAGVSLGYTDEYRGYGNTSAEDHPNQTVLDADPVPFDFGSYDPGDETTFEPSWDPDLDDAAWRPNSQPFSDFGDGWTDNYFDLESADLAWTLDHECLEMDVTSMSGQSRGPETPPGDLEATVAFTRGPGCGQRDYGFGQLANTAPTAVAQAKSLTVFQGEEVVFDGSLSSDDLTPRADLEYSWDVDGDGTEDATGQLAPITFDELGTVEVTLTVTDAGGLSDTDTIEVTVIDEVDEVVRLDGPDRVRSSIDVSLAAFQDPAEVDVAVLATARSFPDALAATSLAIAAGGPVLLNSGSRLLQTVEQELRRLDVETVYVAGGTSAVPDRVLTDIEDRLGVEVDRLSGPNRIETAAEIAREAQSLTGSDDVLVARSDDFADALSASNLSVVTGAPLLLTRRDQLSPGTATALADLAPDKVWVIGGTAAIQPDVEADLSGRADTVERVKGSNRYATAAAVAAVARASGQDVMPTILASGANFPDALAAGPAAAKLGGRLLLANPGVDRNAALLADLETDADRVDLVYIVGGGAALPLGLDGPVLDAIQTDEEAARAALLAADPAALDPRAQLVQEVEEG